jgi:hypothetical protein
MSFGFGFSLPAYLGAGGAFAGASLNLDFTSGNNTLDPRITFTRSTTATFTGSNGLIQTAAINAPRFDYNPVTLAPKGLLIEEQRANLLLQSETFADATWAKLLVTIGANTTTAPDGLLTADKLIVNDGANVNGTGTYLYQNISKAATSQTLTVSCYAKAAEYSRFRMLVNDNAVTTNNAFAAWSLIDGAIVEAPTVAGTFTAPSGTATNVGNGWYRFTLTFTTDVESILRVRLYIRNDGVATGNGVNGIFIWGAQLEAGAFATSYIPTVASEVTRAADNALMTGTNFSSWYNQTEGTLFAQYSAVASGIRTIMAINDGTANESIRLRTDGTNPLFTVTDNGVDITNLDAGTVATGTSYKFAGAYALNNFAASINGGAAVTDAPGALPVNQMMIGNSAAGNYLNGTIAQIAYYNRRLANTELQGITS